MLARNLFVKWLHVFMCGGYLHSCLVNYFHSYVYQLKSVNCQLCEYELNYANLTCFVSFVNWIVPTELKCQLNKCIYYIHAYFKSHTNYLNILCIFSCMQQNGYKDQLCTRSPWVCVSKDELITLKTAHCTSCLFSCLFVTKRQLLSALLYMP